MTPTAIATPSAKLEAGNLLNDTEVAELLGTSLQTVRNWRWKREGPRWVKLGARLIRYRPDDVRAFIEGTDRAVADGSTE